MQYLRKQEGCRKEKLSVGCDLRLGDGNPLTALMGLAFLHFNYQPHCSRTALRSTQMSETGNGEYARDSWELKAMRFKHVQ